MSNINYFDLIELCKDGNDHDFDEYLGFMNVRYENIPKDKMEKAHQYDKTLINELLNKLQGDDIEKYVIASIIGATMDIYEMANSAWKIMNELIIDDFGKEKYDQLVKRMLVIQANKFADELKCPELKKPIARFTIVPKKED